MKNEEKNEKEGVIRLHSSLDYPSFLFLLFFVSFLNMRMWAVGGIVAFSLFHISILYIFI